MRSEGSHYHMTDAEKQERLDQQLELVRKRFRSSPEEIDTRTIRLENAWKGIPLHSLESETTTAIAEHKPRRRLPFAGVLFRHRHN